MTKLTAILLLGACIQVAAKGTAQTVTLNLKKVTIQKVFTEVIRQTGVAIMYNEALFKDATPLTIQVKNASVADVLELCLKNQPLTYTIVDKNIIIKPTVDPQPSIPSRNILSALFPPPPIDVRGTVVNENGEPFAGVTVSVKGTRIATSTDVNGVFLLTGVDVNATLVFTGTNVETYELKVSGKTDFTVKVKTRISKLDEVQIIAYGQTSQRLNTGNVSTVKAADIGKQPVNNPLLALQGRVPGLVITQNTGVPGGGITVRVQGQNSFFRGTDPLYIIDGVPYTSQLLPNWSGTTGVSILGGNGNNNAGYSPGGGGNPLSYINPADIESIDVLKDADATSIYGSRAAHGAILITTKKGKAGKTKVDINVQNGWGKVSNKQDLLNTSQYLEMRRQGKANDGAAILSTDYDINGTWDTTRSTDWQKVLLGGTAQYTDAQASFSGGTYNTNFLISAGYHRETSVFPGGLADSKASIHFNINHISVNEKFRIQMTGNSLADNNKLIRIDLTETALRLAPTAPTLYNPDGTLNWATLPNGNATWYNPLAYFNTTYNIKTNNQIANTLLSYQLLPGLDVKSSFGYTNLQVNETATNPLTSIAPQNRATAIRRSRFGNNNISSWIVEPQLSYKRSIGKGTLESLVGVTQLQTNSDGILMTGTGFNTDEAMKDLRSATTTTVDRNTISVYKYNALFGRINYNLQNKYIVNLTARRDGSSRFGSANLFHNFGSVGGAWLFSNETFIQQKLKFLSFGKLRASYGSIGSDQIGDYQFMDLYDPASANPYQGVSGLAPQGIPNPNLQWEETKKFQSGLDLGFFSDRVLFGMNYYHSRSSNQLLGFDLPRMTGQGSIQVNFPATIENTGWEFTLNTKNVSRKDFSWNSAINLTFPKNKLTEFPDIEKTPYANYYIIGQPVSIVKVYPFAGVDPTTGLYQFTAKDGSKTTSPDYSTDRTILINIDPKFYGGIQNDFHYKGFGLDILFQFAKQMGYNQFFGFQPGRFRNDITPATSGIIIANQPVGIMDRWQKPGDNSSVQRFSATYPSTVRTPFNEAAFSSAAYSDASYIRLKNLSFSWQLPEKWKQIVRLQSARVYIQGQNLLTITGFKGLDPETRSFTNLPPLKVMTLGLQVVL